MRLEYITSQRQMENDIEDIDMTDQFNYLAYQEQIRAKKVLQYLSQYLIQSTYNPDNISQVDINVSSYFQLKRDQIEKQKEITNKFVTSVTKIEEVNQERKIEIELRLKSLFESMEKSKIENREAMKQEILNKIESYYSIHSLEELISCLLKTSELQKDLELLQRRCDYKNFLLSKEARVKARIDAGHRIEELNKDIDGLNANWAEMKDKQRQAAELLQYLQDTIASNKIKFKELTEERVELKQSLSSFDGKLQGISKTTEIHQERTKEVLELEEKIRECRMEIEELSIEEDVDQLKSESKKLKKELNDKENQKLYLETILLASQEESKRKLEEDMKLKQMMIDDLSQELAEKNKHMQDLKIEQNNERKEQVIIRIISDCRSRIYFSFTKWKVSKYIAEMQKVQEEIAISNPVMAIAQKHNATVSWDKHRLYSFFNELMSEKYKADLQCEENNKFPVPLHDYLINYLRANADDEADADQQIAMMAHCILAESETDPLFNILKKMIHLAKDSLPYHIVYFLTSAFGDFNQVKDTLTGQVLLVNVIPIIEQYIDGNLEIASKLLHAMKPPQMSDEDFVLLMLKLSLQKTDQQFTELCDSPDTFLDIAKNELKVLVGDEMLRAFKDKCVREFDMNFDMKIEMSINTLQENKFGVAVSGFLGALIEVYTETRITDIGRLEEITKKCEVINEEMFEGLVSGLDPNLSKELISKLFTEALIGSTDATSINSLNFIQIIMKYGVGGYGIGPFIVKKLSELLNLLLVKSKKSENLGKKPLIEGKIFLTEAKPVKPHINLSEISKQNRLSSPAHLPQPGKRTPKSEAVRKSYNPPSSKSLRPSNMSPSGFRPTSPFG